MINESMISAYKAKGYDVIAERVGGKVCIVYSRLSHISSQIVEEHRIRSLCESSNARFIIIESILG